VSKTLILVIRFSSLGPKPTVERRASRTTNYAWFFFCRITLQLVGNYSSIPHIIIIQFFLKIRAHFNFVQDHKIRRPGLGWRWEGEPRWRGGPGCGSSMMLLSTYNATIQCRSNMWWVNVSHVCHRHVRTLVVLLVVMSILLLLLLRMYIYFEMLGTPFLLNTHVLRHEMSDT
jgi:hypothetical protein